MMKEEETFETIRATLGIMDVLSFNGVPGAVVTDDALLALDTLREKLRGLEEEAAASKQEAEYARVVAGEAIRQKDVATAQLADERVAREAFAKAKREELEAKLRAAEEALREIATLTWNPAIGLPETPDWKLHQIAREALEPAALSQKETTPE